MNTIVIDCGASFLKGALMQDGTIARRLTYSAPAVHGGEDPFAPTQIRKLIPMVRAMILELAGEEKQACLCISNEMHGFLLSDSWGSEVTDYLSWQKEYGDIVLDGVTSKELLQKLSSEEDLLYTGMPLRGGLPSCNLFYLSRKEKEHIASSGLHFYTLGDYILRVLSGKEPQCHPTNAAATGLYDLRTGGWNRRLIEIIGGNNLIFPAIGEDEVWFSMGNLEVCAFPAIGDQQAALLGAGLRAGGTLSFNLGTGAQVSAVMKQAVCSGLYQVRPYFHGNYLKTIPHLPSGRALNVYFRFVKDILNRFGVFPEDDVVWKRILETEKQAESEALQCDLSFFENWATERKTGRIDCIGENSLLLSNLMCSVFRQMSDNFLKAADVIAPDPILVRQIVFSGGVARKIGTVRKNITAHYGNPDLAVTIAEEETLKGLYLYGSDRNNKAGKK